MKLKKILVAMFLMAFGLLLVSCGKEIPVSISLEADFTTVVGETAILHPTVIGLEEYELEFFSEDPDVVSVDEEGNLTALKAGNAVIRVNIAGKDDVEAIVNVRVIAKVGLDDFAPTKVVITGAATLKLHTSVKLTATVTPATANNKLIWDSSDHKIITVLSDGTVYAAGYGTATITAKSAIKDSVSNTIEIKVIAEGTDEEIANSALSYVVSQVPKYVTETFTLPVHPNSDARVEWKNPSGQVRTEYNFITTADAKEKYSVSVKYGTVTKEQVVTLKLVVDLNNNLHEKLPLAAAALSAYMLAIGSDVKNSLALPTKLEGVDVLWMTNNDKVLKANGTYIRPDNDVPVKLTASVGTQALSEIIAFELVAKGYSQEEKVALITDTLLKPYMNMVTSSNIFLPTSDDRFGATLTWTSGEPTYMNDKGNYVNQDFTVDKVVPFTVKITYAVPNFDFEENVQLSITIKPLNDIGKAIVALQNSDFVLPSQVAFGATPQIIDQLTNLPTSIEGHEGVTIAWYGKEGQFDENMKVLIPRFTYTPTEVFARFSKDGLDDAIIAFPINIGIMTDPENEFVFNPRTPSYVIGADQSSGMPAAEGGTGTAYALGFEAFYFKSTFEMTVGEVKVTKTWYHYFALGNLKLVTADHLIEVDGKKFVNKTNSDAVLTPKWVSTTRFYKNTTDQVIYVNKDDLVALGAQAGSSAYMPFVIDKDGIVTTISTPGMSYAPEGFTAYEIPAGGMLVCPGYLEAAVNVNLHNFGLELGRLVEVLPLTGWDTYTAPVA